MGKSKFMALFSAFAAMAGTDPTEDLTPRRRRGRETDAYIRSEYELIQRKESSLSRMERDRIVREYKERFPDG